MTKFPLIALSEVLVVSIDAVEVNPDTSYKISGVYSFGRGLLTRPSILGSQTTYKFFHRLHKNQFVLSQLKAWEGAIALIPDKFDGWFLSPQFPTFSAVSEKLDVNYLDWYCKQYNVWEELRSKSQGMGARRDSVSIKKFLSLQIPLPPLEEQRRIVGRVEELAGKIAEARGLRDRSIQECNLLLGNALKHIFDKSSNLRATQLNNVAEINRGKFAHRLRNDPRFYNGKTPFIQIGDISNSTKYIREYSQTLNEEGLKVSRIFSRGTIVIAITGATIGATGILTFDSCFPDSIVGINSKSDNVMTEYIYWSLEYTKKSMLAEATQTTQPNINLKHFDKLSIIVPPLAEQCRIVTYLDELQAKVDTMKRLRQESLKELDALLPAILDKAFKGEL